MTYKRDISRTRSSTWIGRTQQRRVNRPHSTEEGAKFMTGLFWVLVIGFVLVMITK